MPDRGGGQRDLILIGIAGGTTVAAWVVHGLFGRALLVRLLGSATRVTEQEAEKQWMLSGVIERLPDLMLVKFILLVWLVALSAVVFRRLWPRLGVRGARAARAIASLLLALCLVAVAESFVAPFLITTAGLANFYVALNPDHRMPAGDQAIPTNADGIRSRRGREAFTPERYNVIVLGDSFTFGKGVALEQAFPFKVEQILRGEFPRLDVQVANFGWVTSSPLLSQRLLEDIGRSYRPDLILMCVDMSDLYDDIYYQALVDGTGVYPLFDTMPMTLKALHQHWPAGFWKIYRWRNGERLPALQFFASQMPLDASRPYSAEPFRYFDELRRSVEYPIHSLLDDFRQTEVFPTCFDDDPHWTPAGHSVAAVGIVKVLWAYLNGLHEQSR